MPKTRKGLLEAGYRWGSVALCKECQARIEWWSTPAGNGMPMSVRLVEGCEELISHFIDCKNREQFRRADQAHKSRVEKPRPKTGNLFE